MENELKILSFLWFVQGRFTLSFLPTFTETLNFIRRFISFESFRIQRYFYAEKIFSKKLVEKNSENFKKYFFIIFDCILTQIQLNYLVQYFICSSVDLNHKKNISPKILYQVKQAW